MIRRFEHYNADAWSQNGLRRFFAASVALHIAVFALVLLLVWTGQSRYMMPGAKVAFIPKGHPQGALDDPNAVPVVAPPNPKPEPAAPAPKPPDPTPPKRMEDKPKPPPEPSAKLKEPDKPKPDAKVKDAKETKVNEKAPPKPKPDDKKTKEASKTSPKDKAEKTQSKNTKDKTGKSKDMKLAMDMIPPSDEPAPTGKGKVTPQQGHANGEDKKGVEVQEGLPGVLTYWIGQVQRKVQHNWETPEDVLIVPDQNAAQIGFTVNRKGELVGQPEIVKEASDPSVAKSGLKAILDSAPFPPLPDEFEENQQQVIITFRLER